MLKRFLKNKRVRKACHIYQMLETAAKKKHVSFHTPGHKQGSWDITELSFSDNLSAPRGCIAKAERDIARVLQAEESFILTDGSTCGVLSMLYAAKTLGVKTVAACERSHKSLFNGCAALGLELLLFSGEEKNEIPLPIRLEETLKAALGNADALFITSPDYYGNVAALEELSNYCKAEKKRLLVDGAHGGHLHFDKSLYAGTYADIWVDGVHKSLPAFTQGAVVSASTLDAAEALKKAVDVFRTTSPSYPIMASVEYAVKYPQNEDLEKKVRDFAKTCPRVYVGEDWTKVCLKVGKNAFAADTYLQERGVYSEFCDGENIVFYLSPATSKKQFALLRKRIGQVCDEFPYVEPERAAVPVASVRFLAEGEIEWVDISAATGRICARACGLFPPCTPLINAGEQISAEKTETLLRASNVFGVKNGKIAVLERK